MYSKKKKEIKSIHCSGTIKCINNSSSEEEPHRMEISKPCFLSYSLFAIHSLYSFHFITPVFHSFANTCNRNIIMLYFWCGEQRIYRYDLFWSFEIVSQLPTMRCTECQSLITYAAPLNDGLQRDQLCGRSETQNIPQYRRSKRLSFGHVDCAISPLSRTHSRSLCIRKTNILLARNNSNEIENEQNRAGVWSRRKSNIMSEAMCWVFLLIVICFYGHH